MMSFVLALLPFLAVSMAFTTTPPQSHHKTGSSSTLIQAELKKETSWSEYKHDFIDPIERATEHEQQKQGMDPSKRQSADQFWEAWTEDEKEKLHRLNEEGASGTAAGATESLMADKKKATYDEYQHKNLDPILHIQHHEEQPQHLDSKRRQVADEFWLQTYMDEKAKLHDKDKPMP